MLGGVWPRKRAKNRFEAQECEGGESGAQIRKAESSLRRLPDIGELRYLVVTPNLWEHPVRIQPPPNPSIAKPKWDVDHDFLFSFHAADAVEKDNGDFRL